MNKMIKQEILDLICCVKCNRDLKFISKEKLQCQSCYKEYLVKDNILVLLEEHDYI